MPYSFLQIRCLNPLGSPVEPPFRSILPVTAQNVTHPHEQMLFLCNSRSIFSLHICNIHPLTILRNRDQTPLKPVGMGNVINSRVVWDLH